MWLLVLILKKNYTKFVKIKISIPYGVMKIVPRSDNPQAAKRIMTEIRRPVFKTRIVTIKMAGNSIAAKTKRKISFLRVLVLIFFFKFPRNKHWDCQDVVYSTGGPRYSQTFLSANSLNHIGENGPKCQFWSQEWAFISKTQDSRSKMMKHISRE